MKPFLYSFLFSAAFLFFINIYHYIITDKAVIFVFLISNLILISLLKVKSYLNIIVLNFFNALLVVFLMMYNFKISVDDEFGLFAALPFGFYDLIIQIVFYVLIGVLFSMIMYKIKTKVLSVPEKRIIDETKVKINDFTPRLFKKLKNRAKRINVEIGIGKGHFLNQIAREKEDEFFIGIELKTKNIIKAHKKIKELENTLLIRADINNVYGELPNESVKCFYINHPDPWVKNSRRKNRILTFSFLQELSLKLQKGGKIYITTDFFEYIEASYAMLLKIPELMDDLQGIKTELDGYPIGLYSQKKLQENHKVYYIVFSRKS